LREGRERTFGYGCFAASGSNPFTGERRDAQGPLEQSPTGQRHGILLI
jgi:hypothetical protein